MRGLSHKGLNHYVRPYREEGLKVSSENGSYGSRHLDIEIAPLLVDSHDYLLF
jgi:hypothetical protein